MNPRTRTIAPAPGIHSGVPFAEYLMWDAISRSDLELAARSLAHLRHRLDAIPDPPTPAMVVGQALHLALLEPDDVDGRIVTATINEKTGESFGRGTAKWAECEDANPGKIVLSRLELETNAALVASAARHPAIKALAGRGETEVSAVWNDPETGVLCKCRFDYLVREPLVILDVKSTEDASPRAFQRNAQNYGYFFQLAHYTDGAKVLLRSEPLAYLFALEKDAPHLCANYIVPPDALAPARAERRRLLIEYAKAKKTGQWPGYPEESDLYPPDWVFKQAQFEGGLA